jgi:hypothetical protein
VAANLNVSLEAESTSNGYLGEGRSRGIESAGTRHDRILRTRNTFLLTTFRYSIRALTYRHSNRGEFAASHFLTLCRVRQSSCSPCSLPDLTVRARGRGTQASRWERARKGRRAKRSPIDLEHTLYHPTRDRPLRHHRPLLRSERRRLIDELRNHQFESFLRLALSSWAVVHTAHIPCRGDAGDRMLTHAATITQR